MSKYTMSERIKTDSTAASDFYITHTGFGWYVEAFPSGTLDESEKAMAGFKTIKAAKKCVEAWKKWM